MGDAVIDDMRNRNRMYIIIIIFFIVSVIFGTLLFMLPSGDESQSESESNEDSITEQGKGEQGENQVIVQNQKEGVNNSNSTNNSVEVIVDKFDFDVKTYKFLDERACGAPPEKLFEWFGDPLYALGWEKLPSGGRGEPNSFKFWVWNQSVIFTKGKMNDTTNQIETYHYLVRESTNNSIQVLVDCYELSGNSS